MPGSGVEVGVVGHIEGFGSAENIRNFGDNHKRTFEMDAHQNLAGNYRLAGSSKAVSDSLEERLRQSGRWVFLSGLL